MNHRVYHYWSIISDRPIQIKVLTSYSSNSSFQYGPSTIHNYSWVADRIMYFYHAKVWTGGIRLNYGSWKESWLVTSKLGWRKEIQLVKRAHIGNMFEYIHRDVLFNVGLSIADKETSCAIRCAGPRWESTAYKAKLESRWDIYCVMQTHRVFLHDIIVDEWRHELQTKAPIQSNPINQSINQSDNRQ
jgi:hypothetical protein